MKWIYYLSEEPVSPMIDINNQDKKHRKYKKKKLNKKILILILRKDI